MVTSADPAAPSMCAPPVGADSTTEKVSSSSLSASFSIATVTSTKLDSAGITARAPDAT